uniref:Uncharacterized protein n=1 Tax=Oryza glumipatula TaxID=40148 RepID=A0A0D9Y9Q4_9ORYZ
MRRYSALPGARPDTLADRLHRYRGVLLVILAPFALVSLVLLLMPCSPALSAAAAGRRWGPVDANKYAPNQAEEGQSQGRMAAKSKLKTVVLGRKKSRKEPDKKRNGPIEYHQARLNSVSLGLATKQTQAPRPVGQSRPGIRMVYLVFQNQR